MNPALLAQLAPDRAPPPLGWWPLAPGWWGLVAVLLLALALAGWLRKRARQPSIKRWQRVALRELAQLQRTPRPTGSDDAQLARELQHLLRRYAIARHGRETVASLSGDAWLAFVVRHGGRDWAGDSGQALLRCAYGGPAATRDGAVSHLDRERWLNGARAFIQSKGPGR
ncbi:MAG: hypothetical protein CFE40_01565 [Burkholderiales bacterium PBB1]|nr:MAG: hypothetical protein CFE40_01565 [Burkholderiales bacterium PBB1]